MRDQRASATFWITSPILNGIRSLKRSHGSFPLSVFFHLKKAKKARTIAGIRMNQ